MSARITEEDRRRHIPHLLATQDRKAGEFCRRDPRCGPETTGVYDPVSLDCIEDSRHLFREPDPPPGNREPFGEDGVTPNPNATCHDVRSLDQWLRSSPHGTYPSSRQPVSEKERALIQILYDSRPDAPRVTGQRRSAVDGPQPVNRSNLDPSDLNLALQHLNLALQHAAQGGSLEFVDSLLRWQGPDGEFVDPRADGNYAVGIASRNGYTALVRRLLIWQGPNGEFVDPRAAGNLAVRDAGRGGYLEIVDRLLAWRGPNGEQVEVSRDNALRGINLP